MSYEMILYEKAEPVLTITLNRPQALNAINPQMTAELHQALDAGDADPDVRAIVLTGAGRAFSAGYDIGPRPDGRSSLDATGVEVAEFLKGWWTRDGDSTRRLLHLWHLSTPVIAAVHGWVMGGGFWYSLAADITIAADDSVFAQPEVRHVSNTTFLFAALAGWKAAHRYSLTGDHFDAAEALRDALEFQDRPLSRRHRRSDQEVILHPLHPGGVGLGHDRTVGDDVLGNALSALLAADDR